MRDAFCELLQSKLAYGSHERDAVLLEHELIVSYADGRRPPSVIHSSLIGYGEINGDSMMSKSVGITAAAGATRSLNRLSDRAGQED